jgi:hypothetical protein
MFRNSSKEYNESVFKYLFNATLNCTVFFIRLQRFDGRLLKILMPAQYALFLKYEKGK